MILSWNDERIMQPSALYVKNVLLNMCSFNTIQWFYMWPQQLSRRILLPCGHFFKVPLSQKIWLGYFSPIESRWFLYFKIIPTVLLPTVRFLHQHYLLAGSKVPFNKTCKTTVQLPRYWYWYWTKSTVKHRGALWICNTIISSIIV